MSFDTFMSKVKVNLLSQCQTWLQYCVSTTKHCWKLLWLTSYLMPLNILQISFIIDHQLMTKGGDWLGDPMVFRPHPYIHFTLVFLPLFFLIIITSCFYCAVFWCCYDCFCVHIYSVLLLLFFCDLPVKPIN